MFRPCGAKAVLTARDAAGPRARARRASARRDPRERPPPGQHHQMSRGVGKDVEHAERPLAPPEDVGLLVGQSAALDRLEQDDSPRSRSASAAAGRRHRAWSRARQRQPAHSRPMPPAWAAALGSSTTGWSLMRGSRRHAQPGDEVVDGHVATASPPRALTPTVPAASRRRRPPAHRASSASCRCGSACPAGRRR